MGDFLIDRQKEKDFIKWAELKNKIHFFANENKLLSCYSEALSQYCLIAAKIL